MRQTQRVLRDLEPPHETLASSCGCSHELSVIRFAVGTDGASQSGQSLGQAHHPIVCDEGGRFKGKASEVKVKVMVKGE
jgi:hypothetical protein